MNLIYITAIASALLAAATAILTFPLVARIALAVRAVDYPGGRRSHTTAVPRMGGISISAGIAVGTGLPILCLWQQWGAKVTPLDILALSIGAGLVFLVGLADDVFGLSPIQRLLVQVLAAYVVIFAGWSFNNLNVPFWGEVHLGHWGGLITLLWIVGVTNAINLLDGLDGLAGGVAAIIGTSLLVFSYIQGNTLMMIATAATVGACLGFLRHNWAPARIYMGDSGSLTLGFLPAVMSLHASIKGAATVAILVPLLTLGLPVIDTLLVMAVRFAAKPQGSSVRRFARMFKADRNHLHHLMIRAAPERKHIVFAIYIVAAVFCAMALAVSLSRSPNLGVALIVVEVLVIILMRHTGSLREAARAISIERGGQRDRATDHA
jgi:UDP-GlcNAc:undecaprenyl-phosphate GlcNAc-1-phosphate transferase